MQSAERHDPFPLSQKGNKANGGPTIPNPAGTRAPAPWGRVERPSKMYQISIGPKIRRVKAFHLIFAEMISETRVAFSD